MLLFVRFSWLRLFALVALALLWFVGTGLVRGRIACAHCQQRDSCPALKLFEAEERGSSAA